MNNDESFKGIKLLVTDVDGVLTSGKVIRADSGEELRAFNTQDGFGIKILMGCGIEYAVISSKKSASTQLRMQQLGLNHIYLGYENKVPALEDLLQKLNLSPEQVAYMGDDWPDIAIFNRVGLPIAVANAVLEVKNKAQYVTESTGGKGAVREVIMRILQAQGLYESLLAQYQ